MNIDRRTAMTALAATTALATTTALGGIASKAIAATKGRIDLSPKNWPAGEYARFMTAQGVDRTTAGSAKGKNGAVTVAYGALAARAGLEALK